MWDSPDPANGEFAPAGQPIVVAVHGTMDSGRSFGRLARSLGSTRLVSYDRAGYGRSRPLGVRDIPGHVNDLIDLVRRLTDDQGTTRALRGEPAESGPGPVVLVGHSLGGVIALRAALVEPAVGAVVAWEPPLPWLSDLDRTSPGARAASEADPHRAAERYMQEVLGPQWDRLEPARRAAQLANAPAFAAEMRSLHLDPMVPFDLYQMRQPTVVGVGSASLARHVASVRLLCANLPKPHYRQIAGAAHAVHRTHAEELAGLVREAIDLANG